MATPGKQHCAYCIGTLSFAIAVAGAPDDVNKACGSIECLQFSTEAVKRQFSVADRGRSPFQMAGMCRPNVSVFLRGTAMSGLVLAVKVFFTTARELDFIIGVRELEFTLGAIEH